jgi:hypothetical protein
MPQAANIVIADAQGTPVNHTFAPIGRDTNGVFWYQDTSQANALGYWKISVEVKRPADPTGRQSAEARTYRVRVGLHEPILANVTNSTVSGVEPAPQLAYTPRSFHEFILPEQASLLDRQNQSKMAPLLLQNSQIKAVIENLEYIYG